MLAMAEGVGKNELSRQRQMICAMARKLNTGSMRRNRIRKGFVNKSKQSAAYTSKFWLCTRMAFDELRNSLAQSVN
jgi:hypothetical protein